MATAADPYMEARADAFAKHQAAKLAAQADGGDPASPTDSTDGGTNDPVAQDTVPETPATPEGTEAAPKGTEAEPTAPLPEEAEPAPEVEPKEPTEPAELTDDELKVIWEGYRERLLDTEDAKKHFQEFAQREAARQRLELQREQQEQAQVDTLIQQGEAAYHGLVSTLDTVAAELGKAQREETFNPDILTPETRQAFDQNLARYGYAIVEEVRGRHNRDLDRVVISMLERLPPLSADQAESLTTVVNNAARMYRDSNQSEGAFRYALGEMLGFVVDRVREQAAAEERQRITQRSSAVKKIADTNAAKAAAAKLAAQRGETPPVVPESEPVATAPEEISQAYYEKRKKEGALGEELDRITSEMARQAALGRRF